MEQTSTLQAFEQLASQEAIDATINGLKNNGINALVVKNGQEALEEIKKLIPKGASVMNGASRTLEQIGYIAHLQSGSHGWNNLHEKVLEEKDQAKQAVLRRQSTVSDYYLGSVHALAQNGEFVIASNTGSQLPHIVYSSPHLIFVVSTKKITTTLDQAMERLERHVVPQEDQRMKDAYGMGTMLSKIVIFKKENKIMGRNVTMILVNENVGF